MNATRVVESEPTEFSNMLTAAFTDRASRVLTRAQY